MKLHTFLTEPKDENSNHDVRIKADCWETAQWLCPKSHIVIGRLISEINYDLK